MPHKSSSSNHSAIEIITVVPWYICINNDHVYMCDNFLKILNNHYDIFLHKICFSLGYIGGKNRKY